jgi:hypothetical protein
MSVRRCTMSLFCGALGLTAGWTIGQTTPTTQPAKAAQPTEFKLSIVEVVGPMAELEKTSAEDLAKRDVPAKPRRGKSTPGAEFSGQIDLSVPAKLIVGARTPIASGEENRKRITYLQMKTELTVSGSWKDNQAEVYLNIASAGFGVPGVTPRPKDGMSTASLNRTFTVEENKPVSFKFEDKPQEVSDKTPDQGRLHVGTLTVKRAGATDAGANSTQGTATSPGQQATLEFEAFSVSVERAAVEVADLNKLHAGAPSGAEILKRLGELGEAQRVTQFLATLDVAFPQRMVGGSRLPYVQDIHISRTGEVMPSVTYEEVGTILGTKAGRWERVGDHWVCDLGLKLQASTTAESGLEMPHNVQLPTFVTMSFDVQTRFQSGRAEYFLFRGEPGQGEKGKAPIWVARMVLTRPE